MTAPFDSAGAFVLAIVGLALIIGSPLAYAGSLIPGWQAAVGVAGGLWAMWQVIE